MATEKWDAIVVGAGVIGGATAYHLAKQGHKTLLLDQFYLPHTRGSSNSQTRIIRNFYTEELYCKMMPEAFALWRELEKESGATLFRQTGMLALQGGDKDKLYETIKTMKEHNMKYEWLDGKALNERYPMLKYPDDYCGVLDKEAGALLAAKCLTAQQEMFKKFGGTIRDGEKVDDVISVNGGVVVVTSKCRYQAKKVILCTGPWSQEILRKTGINVPLTALEGYHFYFPVRDMSQESVARSMPIHWDVLEVQQGYGFVISKPTHEYPGLYKVATRGEPLLKYRHPDNRDGESNQHVVDFLIKYVKEHMPFLIPKPAIIDPCVYTMSQDRDYIIDWHPRDSNILLATGFSGHGFKMAPVVGKLLMEMASGKGTSYDVKPFRVTRFKNIMQSKI